MDNSEENEDKNDQTTDEGEEEADDVEKDSHFEPIDDEDDFQSKDEINEVIVDDKKQYFVYWSCLKTLFQNCSLCPSKKFVQGSMLCVQLLCGSGHTTKWYSQPTTKGMASGNLLLSASILLSGNTFNQVKEMMDIASVAFISSTTFHQIQKCYLFPVVHRIYTTNREIIFGNVRDKGAVKLSGDGRCDSPGYSAKFGTYTLMNSADNQIVDFTVTHCSIAGNSARMELHGLKELIGRLKNNLITVSSLTTDRHTQVRKYM